MPSVRTQRFRAVVGFLPGYRWGEEFDDDLVAQLRDRALVFFRAEDRPPLAIVVGRLTYPGCPPEGEPALIVSGTYNPARPHGRTQEEWKQAVLALFEAYRREARQRTVQVEFDEVELHYLADPDNAREGPDDPSPT